MGTQIDLFTTPEVLPAEVLEIIERLSESDYCYETNRLALKCMEKLGYTFDFGLDAEPFDLKKIEQVMKITTDLLRDIHLVLTDEDDRIVAIINVPKGADITTKVIQAIEEDTSAHDVKLTQDLHIDGDATTEVITFDVEGYDEGVNEVESFEGTYFLTQTEIY
jgi:hypothetical protein